MFMFYFYVVKFLKQICSLKQDFNLCFIAVLYKSVKILLLLVYESFVVFDEFTYIFYINFIICSTFILPLPSPSSLKIDCISNDDISFMAPIFNNTDCNPSIAIKLLLSPLF